MTVKRTVADRKSAFVHKHRELFAGGILRTLKELLLQFSLGNFDLDSLINLLLVSTLVVGIVLDGGREESVDEGGLSKSRLAGNLREQNQ